MSKFNLGNDPFLEETLQYTVFITHIHVYSTCIKFTWNSLYGHLQLATHLREGGREGGRERGQLLTLPQG